MTTLNDQLISTLYGAVDEPARWVGLMDLLRDQLGVESVAAQLLSVSHDTLVPLWGTRDSQSERHAALHDSWANSPANPRFRRPPALPRAMELDSDQRSLACSPEDRRVLRDGLARCGLGPAFWMSQQLEDGHNFTLIFHRAPDDTRDMNEHDEALLSVLGPHFRQAIRLWMRLATSETRLGLVEQASGEARTAMVACDRRLQIHWSNADARRMLATGDQLRLRDGRLAVAGRDNHERLLALVEGRSDRDVMVMAGGHGPDLHLRAQSMRAMGGHCVLSPDLVLLVMTRPDCPVRYNPADIALLFGLTMTEGALAAHLAAGGSVSDFAQMRGIAEGTARLHMKRALAKTGSARQSDLVRRICRSVAHSGIVF